MTRRRPFWKILGAIAGALALSAGGLWLWVSSVADRRWEEMKADVLRRTREAARRDASREPLRGDPIPGDAWVDYKAAEAAIALAPGAETLLTGFVQRSKGMDIVRTKAAVASLQGSLDLLRRGGCRAAAQPVSRLRPYRLKMLAVACARIRLEEGRAAEAVEVLLDFVRAGQDSAIDANPSSLSGSLALLEDVYPELQYAVLKGGLPPEALEGLEREVEILDRSSPSYGHFMENTLVWAGNRIQEDVREFLESEGGRSWRYCYHPRLQATAAYFEFASRVPLLADVDRRTWAEERAAWAEFDRRAWPKPGGWSRRIPTTRLRQNLARLRLCRLVFHRRRSGQWLELADPFGTTLRHDETDTHLRVWSVGADGVDHGGKGGWTPRDGEDLLLEVPK